MIFACSSSRWAAAAGRPCMPWRGSGRPLAWAISGQWLRAGPPARPLLPAAAPPAPRPAGGALQQAVCARLACLPVCAPHRERAAPRPAPSQVPAYPLPRLQARHLPAVRLRRHHPCPAVAPASSQMGLMLGPVECRGSVGGFKRGGGTFAPRRRLLPQPAPPQPRPALPCPASPCSSGDSCSYSHGVYECWLHPAKYRTQASKAEESCGAQPHVSHCAAATHGLLRAIHAANAAISHPPSAAVQGGPKLPPPRVLLCALGAGPAPAQPHVRPLRRGPRGEGQCCIVLLLLLLLLLL